MEGEAKSKTKRLIIMAKLGIKQSTEHIKNRIESRRIGRGFFPNEDTRNKMSLAKLGKPSWNKGKKMPKLMGEKMRLIQTGKKHSTEHTEKIRQKLIGKKRTEAQKLSYSLSKMGDKNPAKRPDVRKKMSEAHKGEKSYLWKGGIFNDPYPNIWSDELKNIIRKRDNNFCQLCGKKQTSSKLSVHHIDYNKLNCNENNLISLCVKCHSKTNENRDIWKKYFNYKNLKTNI